MQYSTGNIALIEKNFITGLNAPKDIIIKNHILYVTDINRILGFHLETKEKVYETDLSHLNIQFLNDISFGADAIIYVSATDKKKHPNTMAFFMIHTPTDSILPATVLNKNPAKLATSI